MDKIKNKISYETMQKCKNLNTFDKAYLDLKKIKKLFSENPDKSFTITELHINFDILYSNVLISIEELTRQKFIYKDENNNYKFR